MIDLLVLAVVVQAETEEVRIADTAFTFEIVKIPAGKLKVENREIALKPFWIAKCEATWEAFEAYFSPRDQTDADGITRPSEPHEVPNLGMGTGKHPAVNMRWHSAVGFCDWLSKRTGRSFRLATEAEWEYACRAGATDDAPSALGDYAWFEDNGRKQTHLVGQKKPNAWGLCDMLGNVWEYCLESNDPPAYAPVLRGGSWKSPAAEVRYGSRQTVLKDWFYRDPNKPKSMWWLTNAPFVGFRVVQFDSPGDPKERAAYAGKVEVRNLVKGDFAKEHNRVTGEIVNRGDRTLADVELTIFFMDPEGKPLMADNKARATFAKAYPVLANSRREGEHRKPLKPGESRAFTVDVPFPFDYPVEPEKMGARVSAVHFE
jgi:formylglycine-generating enzyme required for sulfatase activity